MKKPKPVKPATRRRAKKPVQRKIPAKDLGEWGQQMLRRGVPWITVALTHTMVRTADRIYEFEQSLERGEVSWIKASVPDATWEDCYRRPHKMFQQLVNHSFPAEACEPGCSVDLGRELRCVAIAARQMKRMGDDAIRQGVREFLTTPEGKAVAVKLWKWTPKVRRFLGRVNLDTLFGLDEPMDDATYEAGIATRPVQFFMLVWIPCLVAHGESPKVLFQQALQGSRVAMEKLLQADKRLLWCPTMAKVMDEAGRKRTDGRFADFMQAMGGMPNAMTAGRYKCAISAYILRMEPLFRTAQNRHCHRVTSSDIRDAFDAAARERGFQVDEDLPASRESYRKAIQRQRSFAHSKAWDMFPV